MAAEQNPTGSDSGASTPSDPIDRIEAFLAASDSDSTGQTEQSDEPADAAKPDKPEGGEPAKDSEPQITTAQLAAFLGIEESEIDVDEDGTPVFKHKIDGKESTAKFADIRKDYQLKGHAENVTREAAAKVAAAERRLQEAEQQSTQRLQHADQQLQQIAEFAQIQQQDLMADYNAIDWNRLWQDNPSQAGILRDQFQAKGARIQNALQTAAQRQQAMRQQMDQQRQQFAQKALEAETSRVFELIPEWKDPAVANAESNGIRTWALQRGYDPNYLKALSEGQVPGAALVVQDMRRAWQHETLQKSKPTTEAKVRAAPKLVKPGQAPTPGEGNANVLKGLKQQARTTGGDSAKATAAWLIAKGLA